MGNVMASQTVNPELIQLARQSRGLTQTKLASEIRVSQSLIAKYEAGVRDVPPDHLARLAEALDYPVRFFRRPMGRAGSGSEIFHRKRARVPASVLGRNYADAAIRRMEIDALREALDGVFKLTPFPFYPIEEFDYDPEKIAARYGRRGNFPKARFSTSPGPWKKTVASSWPTSSTPVSTALDVGRWGCHRSFT